MGADKIYIGIDNGISGAIAKLFPDGTVHTFKMPVTRFSGMEYIDEEALQAILLEGNTLKNSITIFEQGQKSPLFGTKGNYSNGYSFGVVNTVIRLAKLQHMLVNPKTWQDILFKDIRGKMKRKANPTGITTKEASIEVCKRLYPHVSLLATPLSKKPHDGIADALLMATYGQWMRY